MSWRKVKIGDILERKRNLIEIEDDKEYKLVTVKLYHKGVTLRKVATGSELSSSKMHSVQTGEFILSGIDARHGAFGIIPAELEGAVVSNDFWCLAFDNEVIEKQFFLNGLGAFGEFAQQHGNHQGASGKAHGGGQEKQDRNVLCELRRLRTFHDFNLANTAKISTTKAGI